VNPELLRSPRTALRMSCLEASIHRVIALFSRF
jgi:hypothetical protein